MCQTNFGSHDIHAGAAPLVSNMDRIRIRLMSDVQLASSGTASDSREAWQPQHIDDPAEMCVQVMSQTFCTQTHRGLAAPTCWPNTADSGGTNDVASTNAQCSMDSATRSHSQAAIWNKPTSVTPPTGSTNKALLSSESTAVHIPPMSCRPKHSSHCSACSQQST
jgi:hypothetical protein